MLNYTLGFWSLHQYLKGIIQVSVKPNVVTGDNVDPFLNRLCWEDFIFPTYTTLTLLIVLLVSRE